MKEMVLEAQVRDTSAKRLLKTVRAGGRVPGVFYGHSEKPLALSVVEKSFGEMLASGGANVLVTLKFGDMSKTAIVKDIQRDVLTQRPIHIDFQAISMKEKIEVNVPVHILGIAPGVKLSGGILEHIIRELKVSCLPGDIPQAVNADVSALEIGDGISVKDLPKIKDVDYLADPDTIVINIVAPSVIEEAPAPGTEAVAAGAAEPEVISKGKKEEGADAAAGEKKAEAPKAGKK